MKTDIKKLQLVEKGLSVGTIQKLTESQVNVLHSKLISEQSAPSIINVPRTDQSKINQLKSQKQTFQVYEKKDVDEEIEEDDEVTLDPNQDTETQDPHQVGPSTNDGFNDDDDGMYNFESIEEGKKKTKKNPWAICTAQLGKEFGTKERHLWNTKEKNKYERCVKDVKKSLKEGKNPVSLFLENEIMRIVEKNLPPRITKGDLIKYITEDSPAVAPSKPKTEPATKPGKTDPKPRPKHPGKNPNPGENPSPKAEKVSPEDAKDKVIDLIMQILEK